jgi:alkylglycerol monooxygenase
MFYIVSPWELNLDGSDPKPEYDKKYALPMFFVLIFLEWAVLGIIQALNPKGPKTGSYRVNDFIMSVALGACQATFQLLLTLVGLNLEIGMYTMVYENYRVTTIDTKSNVILTYVCLLLGKDFMYYVAHRFFHEYHTAWIGHSVHHSGEDYNMGTALRQGALQPVFGWPYVSLFFGVDEHRQHTHTPYIHIHRFYLPMAFLGFHPNAFAAHAQLNTYFMFWIHTELVGRLGLLEYIINTPSAHRMHHRPPGNCNYAGALIIWDRMFDTYVYICIFFFA